MGRILSDDKEMNYDFRHTKKPDTGVSGCGVSGFCIKHIKYSNNYHRRFYKKTSIFLEQKEKRREHVPFFQPAILFL